MEKSQPLLPSTTPTPPVKRSKFVLLLKSLFILWLLHATYKSLEPLMLRSIQEHNMKHTKKHICPQADDLTPQVNSNLWHDVSRAIGTSTFKARAIDWIAGAVRVPTESFDNMDPVGVDPRWEAFGPFHDYLLGAFPLVHSTLTLTKVNTYGLFFEWQGSDPSLKPILLAGHQDVVPVAPTTVDQWTHPPYSGYFDGKRVWGRGSNDDKSGLIGILAAIETLLEKGFKPTRTVALAFGFDEEASGFQGAGNLGPVLLEVYGENGIAMIVDEGSGFSEVMGTVFATPGIAEKGYLDVLVEVSAPGGHSSLPPAHTSIGILSALLVQYENHPYKASLSRQDPVYSILQCVGEYAQDIPNDLRKIVKRSAYSDKALKKLQELTFEDPVDKNLVGTTTAIDVIQGGVKANALPEQAWALVNHRISVLSSVDVVRDRDTALLKPLAEKFNLTYNAFGKSISEENTPSSGSLTISDAFHAGLEPAPITPSGPDATPFQLLSGTIRSTYKSHRSDEADAIIVAPGMMSGNTDTRYYWDLSEHIFRYNHHGSGAGNPLGGVHTVNESLEIDAFLEMIRFFITLVLNADESRSL